MMEAMRETLSKVYSAHSLHFSVNLFLLCNREIQ